LLDLVPAGFEGRRIIISNAVRAELLPEVAGVGMFQST
jgi:hypothetical protein